ncbi:MAG: stage II sporulation protein M [Acidimicrobiia bacterium]|nr:stage II sporulation protein M [Acidimicrobiia bacterium]
MGKLDAFVADRSPVWLELEDLVDRAGRRPERLGAAGVRRLGAVYRAAIADLASARRLYAGDPVVARLEHLVDRSRHTVYTAGAQRGALLHFVTTGYWRRVAERPRPLIVAALLLCAPALLAGFWAWNDPGPASGLVPEQYRAVTEPRKTGADLGLTADEEASLAAQVLTNNIRVAMLAFAGGVLAGLGTAFVLLQNGLLLGSVIGLAVGAGNGRPLFELITAHGVLEMSCIVVAGAAGLRIGWALVDPGYRPRGEALRDEARTAIQLVLGTAAWLVVAGLVEGFVTPAGLGLGPVLVVGWSLGAAFWALVLWRGRLPEAPPG